MQNETPAKKFAVKVFSPMLNKYVDHAKECYHETKETALKLVGKFQAAKWRIEAWSDSHNRWQVIKEGDASKSWA